MKITYKYGACNGECGRDHVLIVHKSLSLCMNCNQKRLSKKWRESRSKKVTKGEKADKGKLQDFYREVWDRNPHVCYESGEALHRYFSWHVHHVLHKEDHPALAFNPDVCVLLSLLEHSRWHTMAKSDRARRMPKTWAKYLELCETYNLEP